MATVDELLASYRSAALTEREKGTYFERLSRAFLLADPVQAEQYEAVWTWADWVAGPGSTYAVANGWSGKDVGIDLVAKVRDHDAYAAIQCKFYDPQHRIAQADLAGFIAVSDKAPFHHRVVMDSTVVDWSSNAESMLLGHHRYIIRIGLTELRASPIQWGQFAAKGEVVLAPKKELRPHQVDALNAVRTGFAEHDRGKMIMACGTGKIFLNVSCIRAMCSGSDWLGHSGVLPRTQTYSKHAGGLGQRAQLIESDHIFCRWLVRRGVIESI